ncbi:MAG TPA: peptidylprolyl isomerase, partial [Flavobacterium sp.]|nr:peptidylprolyl isomerase [Flavobacterium sp.]
MLTSFGSGQLSSEEFENAAFALTKEHPISAPFQSKYGWHIVKLIEKHPVRSFEEMKTELESKVGKDDRSRLITNSLNDKLRKQFPIKRNDKLYAQLGKAVTNDFYDNKWVLPTDTKLYGGTLFSVNDKKITGNDFLTYV